MEHHLNQWTEGDITGLLTEGETIQNHLPPIKTSTDSPESFSKFMRQGKVKNAIRSLTHIKTGVLHLDQINADGKSVFEVLGDKHPPARTPSLDVLLPQLTNSTNNYYHLIVFDAITAEVVKWAAIHTSGSAGPSGVDSWCW